MHGRSGDVGLDGVDDVTEEPAIGQTAAVDGRSQHVVEAAVGQQPRHRVKIAGGRERGRQHHIRPSGGDSVDLPLVEGASLAPVHVARLVAVGERPEGRAHVHAGVLVA